METLNNYTIFLIAIVMISLWTTCCPLREIDLPPLFSATFEESVQHHKKQTKVYVQQQLCRQRLSAKGLHPTYLSTASFSQTCQDIKQILASEITIDTFLDTLFFPKRWGRILFTDDKQRFSLYATPGVAGETSRPNKDTPYKEQMLINTSLKMNYDIMFDFLNCDLNGYYFGYRPDTLVVYKYTGTQLVPLSFEEFKKEVL